MTCIDEDTDQDVSFCCLKEKFDKVPCNYNHQDDDNETHSSGCDQTSAPSGET